MDKKTYVLKVLDLLKDSMPLARGLIVLVKNMDIDETFLNTLIKSFQDSIDKVSDENTKSKLQQSKNFLEELKKREANEKALDEQDLEHLDDMLANI